MRALRLRAGKSKEGTREEEVTVERRVRGAVVLFH